MQSQFRENEGRSNIIDDHCFTKKNTEGEDDFFDSWETPPSTTTIKKPY